MIATSPSGNTGVPLIAAFALVVLGVVFLPVLHAPREILATKASMLAGLVVSTPITQVWKISFYTGVVATVGLILTLGPVLIMTYPLLAAIGWACVITLRRRSWPLCRSVPARPA